MAEVRPTANNDLTMRAQTQVHGCAYIFHIDVNVEPGTDCVL